MVLFDDLRQSFIELTMGRYSNKELALEWARVAVSQAVIWMEISLEGPGSTPGSEEW